MNNTLNFYINGKWVEPNSDERLALVNQSTEQPITDIALGNQIDTDAAVSAAKAAFPVWAATPNEERVAALERLLKIYDARTDEMALAISDEMGAPISLAREAQVGAGSGYLENCIRVLKEFEFEGRLGGKVPGGMIFHEPVGVCALITPWNWPIRQVVLKVAPAIGVGCTTVLKPSEYSPLSGILLAEMIDEAGFPAGVFNLVNGDGAGVGSQLSRHPDVDMVSFTGSVRAGVAISAAASSTVKRVSLELGGKGANIIFADADDRAVQRGVSHCFNNSGQSCNAPTRMLVDRSVYQDALKMAREVAESTEVGPADIEGDHIGPVVSKNQFEKIQSLIRTGLEEGATLIAGGLERPEGFGVGYFVRPTVFADVTPDMTIWREEIFGPVLTITPFENENEAIQLANDTPYGLTNFVQTADKTRGRRVARKLRSGMVEMNGHSGGTDTPFGGMKMSGNGREGDVWGLKEYLEIKFVSDWD